jgi:hypothetical protein
MSDRAPRPGGTHEVVGDDEFLNGQLRPNEIIGSAPLVSMAVGRTPAGTGFALLRSTRAHGPNNSIVMVFQRRWADGPETTEESLMIMFQALRWYLQNEGIPLP